ncbi:DUF397 domain-containing protein [Actinocorallia libanotica]|uniref:DUF397 domain-containing protein n=1 Tax=Actinocorallia libanotica TaxID=46162 RepID=A0ABN1S2W6_9ACTN
MTRVVWRKSSRSTTQGGACVEVARLGASVGVRDSKNPDAAHLPVAVSAFTDLLLRIKRG